MSDMLASDSQASIRDLEACPGDDGDASGDGDIGHVRAADGTVPAVSPMGPVNAVPLRLGTIGAWGLLVDDFVGASPGVEIDVTVRVRSGKQWNKRARLLCPRENSMPLAWEAVHAGAARQATPAPRPARRSLADVVAEAHNLPDWSPKEIEATYHSDGTWTSRVVLRHDSALGGVPADTTIDQPADGDEAF